MNEKLKFARKQRYKALRNALKTVDEFAAPSLDPEEYMKFHEVKKLLKIKYKPDD